MFVLLAFCSSVVNIYITFHCVSNFLVIENRHFHYLQSKGRFRISGFGCCYGITLKLCKEASRLPSVTSLATAAAATANSDTA